MITFQIINSCYKQINEKYNYAINYNILINIAWYNCTSRREIWIMASRRFLSQCMERDLRPWDRVFNA